MINDDYQIGIEAADASMDAHGFCVPVLDAWDFMISVYDENDPETADRMREAASPTQRFVEGYARHGCALILARTPSLDCRLPDAIPRHAPGAVPRPAATNDRQ